MNKIKELEQKVKELQEQIEKLKSEGKSGKWKPEIDEKYFFATDEGDFSYSHWINSEADNWRYNNGRIFKTTEECKQYRKFIEDVNKHKYEFTDEERGNLELKKYYICYNYTESSFKIDYNCFIKLIGATYFKTREDAQYIIDNYKEELLKGWL